MAAARTDRLGDLVTGIGGTAPCASCTRVVSMSVLQEGLCPPCRRVPATAAVLVKRERALERGVVWVDASWRDGVAGLAVVGELGEHSRPFLCRSNVAAEVEAMRWALRLAREAGVVELVIRTDSQSAQRFGSRAVPRRFAWVVEWVPRHLNRRADHLSRRARLAA